MLYDSNLRRVERDGVGLRRLKDIDARELVKIHQAWSESGTSIAHALMAMLRLLFNFGVVFLDDPECKRLSGMMERMRFKMPKPKTARITMEQADAFRKKAHEMGFPSMALAQAFQFDCGLRQKDVAGEWVPTSEPGNSEVVEGNLKWLYGLKWSEIDVQNVSLRHTTSREGKLVEINLRLMPMVNEEMTREWERRQGVMPSNGPLIINERTGLPYHTHQFRRVWREIADAAGIPKDVKNRDTAFSKTGRAVDAGGRSTKKPADPEDELEGQQRGLPH
jgi:hypothetical protein